jgi:predicted extracellular nuclease
VGSASFDVSWSASQDGGPSLDGGAADMATGCAPRVNEVQTTGTDATGAATDEFVELYNPCSGAIDLTDWKLVYRSAGDNSGGADSTLVTFSALSIPAAGYVVIGGKTYAGPKDVALVGSGLSGNGGAVGLRNASGIRVDSVSYQTLTTTNALTEGAPAPNPPAGKSIGRNAASLDSDDNSADFTIRTSTPGAAN